MPTVTISIDSPGDDYEIGKVASATYPITGSVNWIQNYTDTQFIQMRRNFDGSQYHITNGYLRFHTGAVLPDDATVLEVTLRLTLDSWYDANGLSIQGEYYVWTAVAADYVDLVGNTAFDPGAITPWSSGTRDFTLKNLTNISTTGDTSIRMGITQRAADAAPTSGNGIVSYAQEHATSDPAALIIYYRVAGDGPGAGYIAVGP